MKRAPNPRACECGEHVFDDLTRGHVTLVSPEDAHLLRQHVWTTTAAPKKKPYARRMTRDGADRRWLALHHCVTGGVMADHKNRNSLDNRRSNLVPCTVASNNLNKSKRRQRTSSRFVGVSYCKKPKLWRVAVCGEHMGYARTEEGAAAIYDREAASRGLTTNLELGRYRWPTNA